MIIKSKHIEDLLESQRKKKRICALKASGLNQTQVAKKIGCTRQYVGLVLKEFGYAKTRLNGNGNQARTTRHPKPT